MINKYNNNSLHGVFFYDSNIWCKILIKLFKYILKQINSFKKTSYITLPIPHSLGILNLSPVLLLSSSSFLLFLLKQ